MDGGAEVGLAGSIFGGWGWVVAHSDIIRLYQRNVKWEVGAPRSEMLSSEECYNKDNANDEQEAANRALRSHCGSPFFRSPPKHSAYYKKNPKRQPPPKPIH